MLYQADLMHVLQTIPWFLELNLDHLQRLAAISDLRQVDAGEVLFHEGEKIDFMFLVLEGQFAIEIFVPNHGSVRIFTAEPLDVFGWSSVTPVVRQRTASARALEASRVLAFNAEALKRLCDDDHDIGYVIMRRTANVIASRLLTTRLQLLEMFVHQSQDGSSLTRFSE
ncbi:MAG TPA: Crp/Fnr family transcriptional regulator [Anaerolineaceae bacterium]|nr:Crp/Fnr family transcriptional regulator [Anaerolineaceae bacterium]